MRKIICESYYKETIEFGDDFPFFLENTDGIHNFIGTVVGTKSANAVGENYITSNEEKRNIIIYGIFKDNFIINREKIYKTFPMRMPGTLYYYEDDKGWKINYYVESIAILEKGYPKTFQISLICPHPYFSDINKTTLQMANWKPTFKFPLKSPVTKGFKFGVKNPSLMATIYNDSDIEYGIIITFIANDVVKNPSMFNVDSREEIKVNYDMNPGDKIIINTNIQNKSILYYSASKGTIEDINNNMEDSSEFLQVHHGQNTFRYNADEHLENLQATIDYYKEYRAI